MELNARYLTARLEFIDNDIGVRLAGKKAERQRIVEGIFASKAKVLRFYSELKQSVEGRLEAVRAEGFEIEIDASFVVDRAFPREFLNHVNQRKRGPFRLDEEARHELRRRVEDTDWSDCKAAISFCDGLLECMRSPKEANEAPLSPADQAHDIKELYDYLFSLEYLSTKYELRLGGKNLNELSPGEKGLLLLIFYLQLDRNSNPLVIDQPETAHFASQSAKKIHFPTRPRSASSCRMTPDSPPAPASSRPRPYRRLRVPPFYPVPVRTRRDGWTVERQADFLGLLAECGSVIGACEGVGMSRKSAYRLRALPGAESFAAAWDAVLGEPSRKVTAPAPHFPGCDRPVHLVMFRGRYRGSWRNAANGDLVAREFPRGEDHRCDADGDSGLPQIAPQIARHRAPIHAIRRP